CVFSKRPFGEADLEAVRRMGTEDIYHAIVGLDARPVLLQFEDILAGCNGNGAGLDKAIHGAVVRFERKITTRVRRNVDFVSLLQHVEAWKHDASFRPETGDDELLLAGSGDRLAE